MVAQNIAFYLMAVAMVGAAVRLVTTKNVVRAALFLAIVLGATAGMFILLLAEFVAWVQVLVYIGAMVVLLLFGVMLTRAPIGRESDLDNDSSWVPALVAVFLLGALVGHAQRRLRLRGDRLRPDPAHGRRGRLDLRRLRDPVRGHLGAAAGRAGGRRRPGPKRLRRDDRAMMLNQFLLLAAVLFCIGVYGVLARKNGVLVLMSIELMLNAVNINLIAFGAFRDNVIGQVFALFVIAIAAAEVGVGLAIVLLIFRNRANIDLDQADLMKG